MKFSKRIILTLFALLILLNIILRYPTTPHEIGNDSFAVHGMANAISTFGYAKWWIHPASIIGLYPYSSPSAVPFLLSGISQCLNMDTESVILLYSMVLGLFSIFAAYLMAGAIWNNDIFKFLVAFVFSTCPGIVDYSTWTANARTLFILSLPLFIYLLLKTRTFKARFSILTFTFLIFLTVTHHYIYFTIPIIISYFAILAFYKLGEYIKIKSVKIPENFANLAVLASFLIMFSIPLLIRTLMDPTVRRSGGPYVWPFIQHYTRYIGILIIFVVIGYIYLVLKRNKKVEEWFLLLCLVVLAPFLSLLIHMKWFILPFACLLIGMSLTNIAKASTSQKRKYATSFVVILLLFSISFTGYYQYIHFLNDPSPYKRYMEERTYVGALWIKDNMNIDKNMIIESYITHKVFSISEVPTLTGIGAADLAYGFVDPKKLEVKRVHSPFSLEFYFSNPYKTVNHTLTGSFVGKISGSDINAVPKNWVIRSMPRFNLSYYVENKDISNTFTRSVQQTKDNVYDNGKIRVWCLD